MTTTTTTVVAAVIQKERSDGILDIPSREWAGLAETLRRGFDAKLSVHDHADLPEPWKSEIASDVYFLEIEVPGEAAKIAFPVVRLVIAWIDEVGPRYLRRKVPRNK